MEEIRIAEIDKEKTGACRSGQKAKQGPSLAFPLQVCKEQEKQLLQGNLHVYLKTRGNQYCLLQLIYIDLLQ